MSRLSVLSRCGLLATAAVTLPTLFGCLEHPLKALQLDKVEVQTKGIALAVNKDVDILFVIDNSFSMGEEQATLAKNFSSFIEVLEAPDVKANYRIGITTTDNGAAEGRCPGADAGQLKLSSCRSRLEQFTLKKEMIDVQQEACLDVCQHESLTVLPSAARSKGTLAERPWIENIDGKTNLPEKDAAGNPVTTVSAFQCFGPQGVAGCGFEQHLESMYKTFLRSEKMDDRAYQFLRPTALLAVVILTDEVDCSMTKLGESILSPAKRVFFSDKALPYATSAVCWKAGVSCIDSGLGGQYEDCVPMNYGENGETDVADDKAMLHPIKRYIDQLQGIEMRKQEASPNAQVLMSLIAGVPTDYDKGAELIYRPGPTGAGQTGTEFGIDFGCKTEDAGKAVPPVRERVVAEKFNRTPTPHGNIFSICQSDYSAALKAIADSIKESLKPACFLSCAADTDVLTPELDPECTVTADVPNDAGAFTSEEIKECEIVNDVAAPRTPEENVCYYTLTDQGVGGRSATPSMLDNMSPQCVAEHWNLEFKLVYRPGVVPVGGTSVKATCKLSEDRATDCPGL